jgi:hypothetical protein
MDRDNLHNVQRLNKSGSGKAKVMLFGEYAGKKRAEEVEDPYYVRNNTRPPVFCAPRKGGVLDIVRYSQGCPVFTFSPGPRQELPFG